MSEPSTTTFIVTGAVATALGPIFGPFALIAFGAVAGSMLAMAGAPTMTRGQGASFVLIGVLIALAITSFLVWLIQLWWPAVPAHLLLMPVAAVIGAARTKLLEVMNLLLDKGGEVLGRVMGKRLDRGDGQ